jgi:hypothetical protein
MTRWKVAIESQQHPNHMLSTSKIGDVEGGSIQLIQRQSAEDKPSKWSTSWATTGRTPSFWNVISGTLKTTTARDIGKQLNELIHHLIPSVQQTINAAPKRKHDGRSRSSTISPIMVL